jgi:phenylacetate-CoA ligase
MDMSEENMHQYVELIREFKPQFISAYPSSIEILARFMTRYGIRDIKPKAVFCESENVYPRQRQIIKSILGCEVYAGYGHSERAVDAVECEQHNGYHISMEYGILELLDKDIEVIKEPGRTGRVVATGFGNYCMPLIRYETDDLANYAANECICGRHLNLIRDFYGRLRDFVISKTGYLVPFSACDPDPTHSLDKISYFNFIQEHEGELIVQIVLAPSVSKEIVEREFLEEIFKRLDTKEFDVKIIFVDRIPRSIRGKMAFLATKRSPNRLGKIASAKTASQ